MLLGFTGLSCKPLSLECWTRHSLMAFKSTAGINIMYHVLMHKMNAVFKEDKIVMLLV